MLIKTKNNLGVTLVEILVIVAIIIILAMITFSSLRSFQKESDLNNSSEVIINTLRLAQNKALSSEGASQHGVYFDKLTAPHQYTLFKGTDYALRDSSFDEVHKLPEGLEFFNGGTEVTEVVFSRVTGSASQAGNVYFRIKNDILKTRTIGIKSSGQITPGEESDPVVLPQGDSRHVHFDLGWTMQDATDLKLHFPDIPQTETIDATLFFNVAKTEFDWDGTFSVGGVDQTLRVHTHSLDAFNTILCIHRDRNNNKNDQEVIIYIVDGSVDKDVAHYLADAEDIVQKGFYVNNTMEKQ
ncbi:hypothetical protein ACFL11_00525 [Patescibacteria group bacterium]